MTHPERWTFDWFHNRQKPELKGNNAMNANTLLELAAKWEKAAEPPQVENGADAKVENSAAAGRRNGLRTCAEDLRLLVKLLG